MNLKNLMIGIVLLGGLSVGAADDWKPRVKDDFDISNWEKNAPAEKFEQTEKVEESVPEKPPEVKSETKPEPKTYKNLSSTPVHLQDGKEVKFEKVVVFSCKNISKKRFLFNKKQTDYCWIKDVKDAAVIAEKIGIENFKKKSAEFEICPEKADSQKACNPKKLRDF